MNSFPFFSVVIPTYNRENIIKNAIDSVLSQSFQDFEIIIINDGSDDDYTNKILSSNMNFEKTKIINTSKVGQFNQLLQNNFTTSSVMCTSNIKLRFEERKYASEDFLLWCLMIFEGYDVYKTDKVLSCIHKLPYGEGGLSGNLVAMEIGALKSYKSLFFSKHISFFPFLLFSVVKCTNISPPQAEI